MKNKANKTKEFNRIFEKAAEEVLQENAFAEKVVAPAVVPPHEAPRLQGKPKVGMSLVCEKTTTRAYEIKLNKEQIIALVRDLIHKQSMGVCAMFIDQFGKEHELDDSRQDGGVVVVRWLTAEEEKTEEDL
jgi:hypothetical protein